MRFLDSDVSLKAIPESIEGCGNFVECSARYAGDVKDDNLSAPDSENKVVAHFKIDKLLETCVINKSLCQKCVDSDFFFYGGGWQSWGFGGEVEPGKNQKKYFPIVPQWKKYIDFPGDCQKKIDGKNPRSNNFLKGQFLIYLRWGNTYLVLASTSFLGDDNGSVLPPVQFYVDRKKRAITVSIYSDGKRWSKMELMSRIVIFSANNYFALKRGVSFVFKKEERFDSLSFLNCSVGSEKVKCAGWESWYNHYADINEKLIKDDLHALGENENIINVLYKKNNLPVVFQVDDGWEKGLGDWDANENRFPDGMEKLAKDISDSGYVPGLWVAPFIIDLRSDTAKKHPEWILKNKNGKPVHAGMNPLWGDKFGLNQSSYPCSYFCLDLSRDDVVDYLDDLMEKVVNQWGFRYVKLDFLFAGMIKGDFTNPGPAYVFYDRAIKKLTRRLISSSGERVAYLGCGLPFESSFDNLPLSRIGPDTKECWDIDYLRRANFTARTGAKPNLQSTLGHSFWDQSIFVNDPDVIFLRYTNIKLDESEKQLIALVNRLFASQIMHSDDPCDFSSDDDFFTQQILSLYEKLGEVDFGVLNLKSDVYQIFSEDGNYCGVINLSEKPFNLRKKDFVNQANCTSPLYRKMDSVELVPVVDNCVVAGELYTAEKHTISIFKIESENGEQ